MTRSTRAPCGVILALALASCTPSYVDTVWPDLRPLGQDVPTYHPLTASPVSLTATEEPVGVLSLRGLCTEHCFNVVVFSLLSLEYRPASLG